MADAVYGEAERLSVFRVLVEFDPRLNLHSSLVGQLVSLQKRICLRGGQFRMCGLSQENYEVVRLMRLTDRLPNYPDRQSALNGG